MARTSTAPARDVSDVEDPRPAILFDLDGTLIDSVYVHVLAWAEALRRGGIELSVWRIHRRIGMSGGLFVSALARETGIELTADDVQRLAEFHALEYERMRRSITVLPGARKLLHTLTSSGVPWAIATSGDEAGARPALDLLNAPGAVLVTRDQVRYAKPDPDLFLEAAERLGVSPTRCVVVGDSIWDLLAAQRAGALSVGLLSGGYGRDELERSGAYRVYDDPADLLLHLDEIGVRRPL